MTDPLGLISAGSGMPTSGSGGVTGVGRGGAGRVDGPGGESPDFKAFLKQQIAEVNALQEDARVAVEDLAAGHRDDIEGVIMATHKADLAFRMLVQVRNKLMEAYEEVKQIRV